MCFFDLYGFLKDGSFAVKYILKNLSLLIFFLIAEKNLKRFVCKRKDFIFFESGYGKMTALVIGVVAEQVAG